jgi:hypothetical protein
VVAVIRYPTPMVMWMVSGWPVRPGVASEAWRSQGPLRTRTSAHRTSFASVDARGRTAAQAVVSPPGNQQPVTSLMRLERRPTCARALAAGCGLSGGVGGEPAGHGYGFERTRDQVTLREIAVQGGEVG